jgi:hypothetical protein
MDKGCRIDPRPISMHVRFLGTLLSFLAGHSDHSRARRTTRAKMRRRRRGRLTLRASKSAFPSPQLAAVEALEQRVMLSADKFVATTGFWDTPGNWSNGVPGAGADVDIPAGATVTDVRSSNTGTNALNSLTVESGATLNLTGDPAFEEPDRFDGHLLIDDRRQPVVRLRRSDRDRKRSHADDQQQCDVRHGSVRHGNNRGVGRSHDQSGQPDQPHQRRPGWHADLGSERHGRELSP